MKKLLLLLPLLLLAACEDTLPDWLGGESDKVHLEGERIPILKERKGYEPDESIKNLVLSIPEPIVNDSWAQMMGGAASYAVHPALSAKPIEVAHTSVGEGNDFKEMFFISPVVAAGVIYAMDAQGYITAHDAGMLATRWTSEVATHDGDDILGGGLAYDNGTLFVTTGYGKVMAIDAANGKERWAQKTGAPVRVAPKVEDGKVVILTVDNQTMALDASDGSIFWTHRGIAETAGFVARVAPSIHKGVVIAPYSSGEISALDLDTGEEIWSDTLTLMRRTVASAIFAGIGGVPVMDDDAVYAVSHNGLTAVTLLSRGARAWEQEASSDNTLWVAGDFVFVLTTGDTLLAYARRDGRLAWTTQVDTPSKDEPIHWYGPVLAGNHLWLAGDHGVMLSFSPITGVAEGQVSIPDGVTHAPVIAAETMYFVTRDATLYAYK